MNPILMSLAQAHPAGSREIIDKLARTPLSQIVVIVAVLTVLRAVIYPYLRRVGPHGKSLGISLARFANEMLDSLAFAGVLVFMLIRPFGLQAFLIPTGSMWPELFVNSFIVANKAIYRFTDPKANDVVVFHPPKEGALSPDDLDSDGEMKFDFIKRCIGTPGDLIEMKNGVLYRNGQKVDEEYKAYSACLDDPNHCQNYRMLTPDEKKHITPTSFKLINYKGSIIPLNYDEFDANSPLPEVIDVTLQQRPYSSAEKYQIPSREEQQKAIKLPAQRLPKGMYLMMGDNRNNSYDGRAWGLVSRDRIVGRAEMVWWPFSQIHRTR